MAHRTIFTVASQTHPVVRLPFLCFFSPSVAGLRKISDCCAKNGELFNITYNANKSYCMVIDSKPQDMKHINCANLNNHPLPYTTKCKYLGHIINNFKSLVQITFTYINSIIILLNLPSRCRASFMFGSNYIISFNERIRSSMPFMSSS